MVMRKKYVKPEIMEVEVAIGSMLAASLVIDKTSKGDCVEDFVRGRRGSIWGDLWIDNDKENNTY